MLLWHDAYTGLYCMTCMHDDATLCWQASTWLYNSYIKTLCSLCRKSFEAGKVFGRRQTFWDAVFAVIAGQERNAMGMLLKVVFSAMINFTIGMVCSTFVFIFKLPWILLDYKPGWVGDIKFVSSVVCS